MSSEREGGLAVLIEKERKHYQEIILFVDISSGVYLSRTSFRPYIAGPIAERDDGIVLAMLRNASRSGLLKIALIASIFGNVDGRKSFRALQRLHSTWGSDAPEITQGALVKQSPSDKAVEKSVEQIKSAKGKVTLVALGPFTDIAEVVKRAKEKEIEDKIARVILATSAEDVEKNISAFNSVADPAAIKYLKQAGVELVYGWDGVLEHGVTNDMISQMRKVEDSLYKFVLQGVEMRNFGLMLVSKLANRFNNRLKSMIGVLPEAEKRGWRMCIQGMIIPVYLIHPDLFKEVKTDYGVRVEIKDHEGVDKAILELLQYVPPNKG